MYIFVSLGGLTKREKFSDLKNRMRALINESGKEEKGRDLARREIRKKYKECKIEIGDKQDYFFNSSFKDQTKHCKNTRLVNRATDPTFALNYMCNF